MTRQSGVSRAWRIPRTGLVAAIVTFLVLGSSAGAYAYWAAQASLTSTAKAGSIAVSLGGFDSMQKTFANNLLTHTGSITVSNTSTTTSTAPLHVSIGLGIASGSNELASNLGVAVWEAVTTSSCDAAATQPTTATTGSWKTFSAIETTLAAGHSKFWCIRTSATERSNVAASGGTLSIVPKATATLTAGTWTATATATTAQNTQYIYPSGSNLPTSWVRVHPSGKSTTCLDILGSGGAGTSLIEWPCTVNWNQQFKLSGTNGYRTVTPRHSQGLRWNNSGSGITVESASASANQSWQFQEVSTGVYQIVNNASGLCLAPGGTLVGLQTGYIGVACNGSGAQRFTLEAVPVPVPVALTLACTTTGQGGPHVDVVYSWDSAQAGSYTFQADNSGWQTIGTSGPTDSQITIDGTQPSGNALEEWDRTSYNVRVLDSNSNVVGTSSVTVQNGKRLACQ